MLEVRWSLNSNKTAKRKRINDIFQPPVEVGVPLPEVPWGVTSSFQPKAHRMEQRQTSEVLHLCLHSSCSQEPAPSAPSLPTGEAGVSKRAAKRMAVDSSDELSVEMSDDSTQKGSPCPSPNHISSMVELHDGLDMAPHDPLGMIQLEDVFSLFDDRDIVELDGNLALIADHDLYFSYEVFSDLIRDEDLIKLTVSSEIPMHGMQMPSDSSTVGLSSAASHATPMQPPPSSEQFVAQYLPSHSPHKAWHSGMTSLGKTAPGGAAATQLDKPIAFSWHNL